MTSATVRCQNDPLDLHHLAQLAEKAGNYKLSGQLYREAATVAYARSGSAELIRKAKHVEQRLAVKTA